MERFSKKIREKNRTVGIIGTGVAIGVLGLSYAAVPLYRMFCQMTGFGGTTKRKTVEDLAKASKQVMPHVAKSLKPITVSFVANVGINMPWKFIPMQSAVQVVPGESVLAFFHAMNPTDESLAGISTYNVTPAKAGQYFNKIQCFCFEEQKLSPGEELDMPVFFYLDPAILTDPKTKNLNHISLSYTFWKTDYKDDHFNKSQSQPQSSSIVAETKT